MARAFLWIQSTRIPHILLLITALLFAALLASPARAGTVSLAWDAVNSPALVGYMLHYGPAAGNYPSSIDVGNRLTYVVPNLTEGSTYHFVVTAYDAAKTQSPNSNDVSATVPYSVPVANFTASATTGVAPLALNFTSTSTGTITSYVWTFGDSTTSTAQNPAKVYSTPGIFTVSLKVTGPGGTNTKTATNYITVTAAGDTTPPSAPSGVSATPAGTTAINLAGARRPTTSASPTIESSAARERAVRPSSRSRRSPAPPTRTPVSQRARPTATESERPTQPGI